MTTLYPVHFSQLYFQQAAFRDEVIPSLRYIEEAYLPLAIKMIGSQCSSAVVKPTVFEHPFVQFHVGYKEDGGKEDDTNMLVLLLLPVM